MIKGRADSEQAYSSAQYKTYTRYRNKCVDCGEVLFDTEVEQPRLGVYVGKTVVAPVCRCLDKGRCLARQDMQRTLAKEELRHESEARPFHDEIERLFFEHARRTQEIYEAFEAGMKERAVQDDE